MIQEKFGTSLFRGGLPFVGISSHWGKAACALEERAISAGRAHLSNRKSQGR